MRQSRDDLRHLSCMHCAAHPRLDPLSPWAGSRTSGDFDQRCTARQCRDHLRQRSLKPSKQLRATHVAEPDPDHCETHPGQGTALRDIPVLGDDGNMVTLGPGPGSRSPQSGRPFAQPRTPN